MTRIGHNFRAVEELPIPEDVRADRHWTETMVEMAAHIGPYRTLLLVDRFGGMRIYVPADWRKGKTYEGIGAIRDVIGDEGARILSDVYRREYLLVPTARAALAAARRAPLIAQIRSGDLSITEGARILGTKRSYLSHLVNHSTEGGGDPGPTTGRARGQMDLFGDD